MIALGCLRVPSAIDFIEPPLSEECGSELGSEPPFES